MPTSPPTSLPTSPPIFLDDLEATITDVFTLTEPGEDGDAWRIEAIRDVRGAVYLLESAPDETTLYRHPQGQLPAIDWEAAQRLKIHDETGRMQDTVDYAEGESEEATYLMLGDEVWELDDYALRRGPGRRWIARACTRASALPTCDIEPSPEVSGIPWGWIAIGLLGLAFTLDLLTAGGFAWLCWITGGTMMFVTGVKHVRRTLLIAGGAFGGWLLTCGFASPALGLITPLAPEAALAMWGLLWLAAFLALGLLTHRTFYIAADGASLSGTLAAMIYTLLLFGYACADEDFSWIGSWAYYFRSDPYRFFWLAALGLGWIYYYRDYRRVPLSARAFFDLRTRLATALRDENPFRRAKRIGRSADDLADALHLCDEIAVTSLTPYREQLLLLAKVFSTFADGDPPSALRAFKAQVLEDLRLLAGELEAISVGGKALRISPILRFCASNTPCKNDWLATRGPETGRSDRAGSDTDA